MTQYQRMAVWPTVPEMVTTVPLYSEFDISEITDELILDLEYFDGVMDAYCVECRRNSVFKGKGKPLPASAHIGSTTLPPRGSRHARSLIEMFQQDRFFELELTCSRVREHQIVVFLRVWKKKLIKVGQYPSLADLQLPDLDRYKDVLTEEDRREFARAIGLQAHGIGIGSFVYLRRIFEKLVERAHTKAQALPGWDEQSYQDARMQEKIQLLKDQLPAALVENANIYRILSVGIHALSEDDCLSYFSTVKLGIEMILDQEVERVRKQKQESVLKNELGKIAGQLGKDQT